MSYPFGKAACVVLLMAGAVPAGATLLDPGSCVGKGCPVTKIQNFGKANPGTEVAATGVIDVTVPVKGSKQGLNVEFSEVVYREADGMLNFDYQFEITGAIPTKRPIWLTADDFTGVTTNVGFTRSFSLIPGVPASQDNKPLRIQSGPDGDSVSFGFSPGKNPPSTYYSGVLVVETDATSFQGGLGSFKDGRTEPIEGAFAPGPEPESIVLLGSCMSLLGALAYFRRRGPLP
jgi:hypothetical protein